MSKKNKLSRILLLVRDDSGSELVEFSFAAMILLALFFGIMDCSRAMYCYHYVSYAAQDGARYAMVRGADGGTSSCSTAPYACMASAGDVQSYVTSQLSPLIDSHNLTVNTTWPGKTPDCTSSCTACSPQNSQGCLVQVQVAYNFSFMLPFLPKTGLTFTGTSEKVIQ